MKVPTDLKLELTVHDVTYRFGLGDFTGQDELAIYRVTGLSLPQAFTSPTLFAVSALIWRHRVRQGETELTFNDVASKMTFNDVDYDVNEDEDGGSPEPSAGNSPD